MFKNEDSLYLVLTEEYCSKPATEIAREAIDGGIDILQMREKGRSKNELLKIGGELRKLCKDIPFIVNDDPYLAIELNADGVHLGQEDLKIFPEARQIMNDKIIGLSTHNLEQVKKANDTDVDYIAYGPIFETQTKDYSLGLGDIKEVITLSNKPVVFIGGINNDNIGKLTELGAKNIAVIRAITTANDVSLSIKKLKNKIMGNICIILNGKRELVESRTLINLLKEKNFNPESIIIEYNKKVARPEEWNSVILRNNDNLEIVGFFAGG